MRARELVLTFALAASWSPRAVADTADAGVVRETLDGPKLDALFADVARARKEVRTLRADFTQERRIRLLATTVKSRGELTFAAPDRLRWELAPPDEVVYFIGPEGLAYRTKGGSNAVPRAGANIGQALGDLRALLTGDVGTLRDRWTLTASRSAADVEIAGVAKNAGAPIRAFTVVLDKNLTTPIRARLVEGKADSIDLVFSKVVLNGPVDPARLRP